MNRFKRNQIHRRRAASLGFTLIEVLLVLAILVVLGTIAATQIWGAADQADEDAAKAQVELLADSINLYRIGCKQWPESLDDLFKKPSDSAVAERWRGPYLDKQLSNDPWNNEYKYAAEGKHNPGSFDVWSAGPDGQDGSDDDIGNWEK